MCPVCAQAVVRHAGDVCASCRYKGHKSLRDTKVDTQALMGALEPRILIEQGLRQFRIMQERLQQVLDSSGVFRGDTLNEGLKIAKGLQTLAKEYRLQTEFAKSAADELNQEERIAVLVDWFHQLPSNQQKDVIQQLTRAYNEQAA